MARALLLFVVLGSLGISAQVAVPAGAGAQAPPGAGPARSGTALIAGRVLDADSGSPIAAATVSIRVALGRSEMPGALTDAEGRYFFRDLAPASYTVSVTKPGWLDGAFGRGRMGGASTPVVVKDGQRQTDVDVRLWRVGVITGRVTDPSGDPMVAVDVRAFRLTYLGGRQQPVFVTRARTDDRGIYRFATLEPAEYVICVPATVTSEPSGFASVIRAQRATPAPYLQTMSGIGTAPMTLNRSDGSSGSSRWGVSSILEMPASPPANGAWLTYPTTYAPSAVSRTAATVVRVVSGRERAGVDITIRLMPTFRVSGIVSSPEGPAAYHAVHLLQADAADAPVADTATAISDTAGAFTFFGVPAGSYIARVVRIPEVAGGRLAIVGGTGAIQSVALLSDGPGPAPPAVPAAPLLHASQPVTVGDRDVNDVAVFLRAGPRLSGRVQFEGAAAQPTADALQRMQIVLEPATGQLYSNVQPGAASATGQFTSPSTWPGRYLVRVSQPPTGWTLKSAMVRGRDVSETPLDFVSDIDDAVLLFTDKTTTLSGTVQAESPSSAAVPTIVIVFPADPAGWVDYGRTTRRLRGVSASPAGAFTMPAPPEGEYFLVAIADADAVDWQNPAFLQRLAGVADRIQLREGQSLTRTVRVQRVQ